MKPSLRLLAGAAALLAVSIAATGCDTAPSAVTVNSQAIKEPALYFQLHEWGTNRAYVSAFDTAEAGTGGSGVTVAGDAPGTYNTTWVTYILNGMVAAAAVHQHVVATHQAPTPAIANASRAVSEFSHQGYWEQFSPGFRQTLTTQLAEQATITPSSFSAANLLTLYRQFQPYFFTKVCVLQASAFSSSEAQSLVSGGLTNGAQQCYDQTQFEQQGSAFQSAVLGLAVGKVAPPIKTSYGYQVAKVVSRDVQAFSPAVQRVLSVAVVQAQNDADPVLSGLLTKARVQVNPAYGSWQKGEVVAPSGPPGTLMPSVLSQLTPTS